MGLSRESRAFQDILRILKRYPSAKGSEMAVVLLLPKIFTVSCPPGAPPRFLFFAWSCNTGVHGMRGRCGILHRLIFSCRMVEAVPEQAAVPMVEARRTHVGSLRVQGMVLKRPLFKNKLELSMVTLYEEGAHTQIILQVYRTRRYRVSCARPGAVCACRRRLCGAFGTVTAAGCV